MLALKIYVCRFFNFLNYEYTTKFVLHTFVFSAAGLKKVLRNKEDLNDQENEHDSTLKERIFSTSLPTQRMTGKNDQTSFLLREYHYTNHE